MVPCHWFTINKWENNKQYLATASHTRQNELYQSPPSTLPCQWRWWNLHTARLTELAATLVIKVAFPVEGKQHAHSLQLNWSLLFSDSFIIITFSCGCYTQYCRYYCCIHNEGWNIYLWRLSIYEWSSEDLAVPKLYCSLQMWHQR